MIPSERARGKKPPSSPKPPEQTKGLTDILHRRTRAVKDASEGVLNTIMGSGSSKSGAGDARLSSLVRQSDEASGDISMHEEENEGEELDSDTSSQAPQNEASFISFGALLRAQASLAKPNGRNDDPDNDGYAYGHGSLEKSKAPPTFMNNEALERRAGKKDTRDFLRTSKHAPAELSSKKAVSRKREVVPTQKPNHRDPRFEPINAAVDERKIKQNYSFLDAYRDSEVLELKLAIRKTKDSEGKEKLKRALLSLESRKKAQQIKEQQQEVLRRHRKVEKEKIEQGKRPFYLKKADQTKMALIERFEGMKGKQVDKVIERRRKKKAAKEKKGMPDMRRG